MKPYAALRWLKFSSAEVSQPRSPSCARCATSELISRSMMVMTGVTRLMRPSETSGGAACGAGGAAAPVEPFTAYAADAAVTDSHAAGVYADQSARVVSFHTCKHR